MNNSFCGKDIRMKEVSVIIATYNPNLERVLFSIDSVMDQEGIDYELIISDDGSKENYFSEIEEYIKSHSKCDFQLIAHKTNQGTVKNFLDAVNHSRGAYIRTIGAGDALYDNHVLRNHVDFLMNSGRMWSFGQMVYFSVDEMGDRFFVKHRSRPQLVKCFEKKQFKKCVWNYCAYNDIATGTAILYEKALFQKYLELIKDKVIYCEDYTTKIMMFDGIIAAYYPSPVIYYEFASGGISDPNNSEGGKRAIKDIRTADEIMISRNGSSMDKLHNKIRVIYQRRKKYNYRPQTVLMEKGKCLFALRKRICPRMTMVPRDNDVLKRKQQ